MPITALAIWLYRDKKWEKGITPQKLIDVFIEEFRINSQEMDNLFLSTAPSVDEKSDWLSDSPFSWDVACGNLQIPAPPDSPKEEGGTLAELELNGVGPARDIHIGFGERINLITGDNGLGKSFILDCAWWALTNSWADFPIYPRSDERVTSQKFNTTLEMQEEERIKVNPFTGGKHKAGQVTKSLYLYLA